MGNSEKPIDPLTRELSAEDGAPVKLMSIEEFARKVGVSTWTLRDLAKKRMFLPAHQSARGGRARGHKYSEAQVQQFKDYQLSPTNLQPHQTLYASTYTGQEAQTVFKLLGEQKSLRDVVIHTGIHPDIIDVIARRWMALEFGLFVSPPIILKIRELALGGPSEIKTEEDLYEVLKLAAGEVPCTLCKKSAKDVCRRCVAMAVKKERVRVVEAFRRQGQKPHREEDPQTTPQDPQTPQDS